MWMELGLFFGVVEDSVVVGVYCVRVVVFFGWGGDGCCRVIFYFCFLIGGDLMLEGTRNNQAHCCWSWS